MDLTLKSQKERQSNLNEINNLKNELMNQRIEQASDFYNAARLGASSSIQEIKRAAVDFDVARMQRSGTNAQLDAITRTRSLDANDLSPIQETPKYKTSLITRGKKL